MRIDKEELKELVSIIEENSQGFDVEHSLDGVQKWYQLGSGGRWLVVYVGGQPVSAMLVGIPGMAFYPEISDENGLNPN